MVHHPAPAPALSPNEDGPSRAERLHGDVPISRLTPELLRELVAKLTCRRICPRDRCQDDALGQADTQSGGVRPSAPLLAHQRDPPAQSAPIGHASSRSTEVDQAIPDRYQALPVVAASTGLRWGELAGLRFADIDMLRRRLTVRSALIEAAGDAPRLGRPKTAASERTITLPGIALDAIVLHLIQHPLVDGLMWTTERGAFLRRGSFSRLTQSRR